MSNQISDAKPARPKIVCLCGSTRFTEAFQTANFVETMDGHIVLTVGCDTKSDATLITHGKILPSQKAKLDELHKRKIDLADEILVLNVGGYIGQSTRSEIEYARSKGKPVRWLEPDRAETPGRLMLYHVQVVSGENEGLHDRLSIHELLDGLLDLLEDCEDIEIEITRRDMSQAEYDALPAA